MIEMNRFCKFCQGAKGFCSFFDIMEGKRSCMGSLSMRPEWCPMTEFVEVTTEYDKTYKQLWVKND